jgi:lipopolysaccharide export system permease protein
MKIYIRYILQKAIATFFVINSILIGLISLLQLLKFIYLINKGAMLLDLLDIVVLSLPSLLFVIFPISTCLSILYCYHSLIKNHEMTALRGIGLTNLQIALPGLVFTILMTGLTYYITLSIAPSSFNQLKNKVFELKSNYALAAIQANSFNYINKNITVYVGRQTSPNLFDNIIIFDNTEGNKLFVAEEGELHLTKGILELKLKNGLIQTLNSKSTSSNLKFSEFSITKDINTDPSERLTRGMNEYYLLELLQSKNTKYIAEGHQKIIWPIYNFLLVFFALGILLKQTNVNLYSKVKIALNILIIIAIYFALHILSAKNTIIIYLQYIWLLLIFCFSLFKLSYP